MPVAPAMTVQGWLESVLTSHWYSNWNSSGKPDQVPSEVVSVSPTTWVPESTGLVTFDGGAGTAPAAKGEKEVTVPQSRPVPGLYVPPGTATHAPPV